MNRLKLFMTNTTWILKLCREGLCLHKHKYSSTVLILAGCISHFKVAYKLQAWTALQKSPHVFMLAVHVIIQYHSVKKIFLGLINDTVIGTYNCR